MRNMFSMPHPRRRKMKTRRTSLSMLATMDPLDKNVDLVKQIQRMEREHEETIKELLESNGDLEQRNNELFERCKLLNKNRVKNMELDSEKKRLEQEIIEIQKKHELRENAMIDQMNELKNHNTELIDELRSVRDKNSELGRANARLSVDLEKATGKIRKLSNEMSSLDDQTSTLRWRIQNLSSQTDRLSRDLAVSQEKLVTAERNAAIYKDEIIRKKTMISNGNSSELSDHCFCNICCEEYDSVLYIPRMLRCGHTFCGRCCDKLRTDNTIKCPTCKCVCVYESGVQPSKNYFAISVSEETLKPVSKANCETCLKLSFDQRRMENEENKIETEKMEE